MRRVQINKSDARFAAHKNINTAGRITRFLMATVVLVYGMSMGSGIALAIAGYTYYEAFAKWCDYRQRQYF